jgi:hypothetical protein
LAIDTSKVYQIDIDCEEYDDYFKELMKSHPSYKSLTKSYGRHIFITDSEFQPSKQRMQFKKHLGEEVELLCGQWAWCALDAKIEVSDGVLEVEDLQDKIKAST